MSMGRFLLQRLYVSITIYLNVSRYIQVEKKHLRLKCPHVKSIFTFVSKHFKQTIITVYFFCPKRLTREKLFLSDIRLLIKGNFLSEKDVCSW